MRDPDTGNSKGYAFINFASFEAADSAIEAMNGQFLCNRAITISYAFRKDAKGERHGSAAGLCCLFFWSFFGVQKWKVQSRYKLCKTYCLTMTQSYLNWRLWWWFIFNFVIFLTIQTLILDENEMTSLKICSLNVSKVCKVHDGGKVCKLPDVDKVCKVYGFIFWEMQSFSSLSFILL